MNILRVQRESSVTAYPRYRLALLLIGLATLCAHAARAEMMDISIHVHDRQSSGLPWRGSAIPQLVPGPLVFGQLHNSAPSVTLCIFRQGGDMQCRGTPSGQIQSPCPLSYDCEFDDVALPSDDLFGLVFVSQGMIKRGLVDALILTRSTRRRSDPAVRSLDEVLRNAAARLAPADPTEAARRSRHFPVFELGKCGSTCSLTQSEFKISRPGP